MADTTQPPPGQPWRMPAEIVVDRTTPGGPPRVTIDGYELPWYSQGISVNDVTLKDFATVTITFVADRVVQVNEQPTGVNKPQPAASGLIAETTTASIRFRCAHSGCIGAHTTPNEACC
jgi:hypothetical protein